MTIRQSHTGWKLINPNLHRSHFSKEFLGKYDALLYVSSFNNTLLLLGDVNNGARLSNAFPFNVQYLLSLGEEHVSKIWLIANRARCILQLTVTAQDAHRLYTLHTQAHSEASPRAGGDGSGDGQASEVVQTTESSE